MKRVAIVGSHRDSRELAPWDDPSIDIWVFNEAYSQKIRGPDGEPYRWCKRADAVFQLHRPVVYRSEHNRSDRGHWQWLQQDHGALKIYMQEADEDVPNAVRLPIEDLHALLDNFRQGRPLKRREYLTSSIAIALALAIAQGYEQIEIYGVNMSSETEYHYQRECVTFWIGVALGRGIAVDMVSGRDIFERPVYGYEGYIEAKVETFAERGAALQAELVPLKTEMRTAEDALEAHWGAPDVGAHIEQLAEVERRLGVVEGALFETERYAFKAAGMLAEGHPFAFIDRNEYELAAAQANRDQLELGPNVYRTVGHVDMALASYRNTRNPAHLEQLKCMVERHVSAAYNSGRAQGIFDENRRLAYDVDARIRAAGGGKTLEVLRLEHQL